MFGKSYRIPSLSRFLGENTNPFSPEKSTQNKNGSFAIEKWLILAMISRRLINVIKLFKNNIRMLLLLDNHDSFTWNLVELLRNIGKVNVKIVTPENLITSELEQFDRIIFSPGPGLPGEQPAMSEILKHVDPRVPVLGVCLGMQAIAEFYGGSLINLPDVVHGQTRKLEFMRPDHPLFRGIPSGTPVGLYHSWAVDPQTLPSCLEILATTPDGTIMALEHRTLPVCGVQFHPESVMSPLGPRMIANWLGK
jgi:anthranilate synthase/aminodeoxychorismate synthase-like glutamine amidotransferase